MPSCRLPQRSFIRPRGSAEGYLLWRAQNPRHGHNAKKVRAEASVIDSHPLGKYIDASYQYIELACEWRLLDCLNRCVSCQATALLYSFVGDLALVKFIVFSMRQLPTKVSAPESLIGKGFAPAGNIQGWQTNHIVFDIRYILEL